MAGGQQAQAVMLFFFPEKIPQGVCPAGSRNTIAGFADVLRFYGNTGAYAVVGKLYRRQGAGLKIYEDDVVVIGVFIGSADSVYIGGIIADQGGVFVDVQSVDTEEQSSAAVQERVARGHKFGPARPFDDDLAQLIGP